MALNKDALGQVAMETALPFYLLSRLSRGATYFLLLRQMKVSKEKATLLPVSLRYATGNLRCSPQPGQPQTRLLRRLKQRVWLLPSGAVRLGTGRRDCCKNAVLG